MTQIEIFAALTAFYLVYLSPIIVIGIPVILTGRKRVRWVKRELLLVFLPFLCLISSLMKVHPEVLTSNTILSNYSKEPLLLGIVITLTLLAKCIYKDYFSDNTLCKANTMILLLCIYGALMGIQMGLPSASQVDAFLHL